ncbi:MAG: PIN domain nuclease [Acidimicrobiales bacterium]
MALVLDAGGLDAVDRLDRNVGALLRVAQQERMPVRTSAAVVAQVWRDGSRQANLARVPAGVDAVSLDGNTGRAVGEVLALSNTVDVVDGHLGSIVRSGDTVLTSDSADITRVLNARKVDATVRRV